MLKIFIINTLRFNNTYFKSLFFLFTLQSLIFQGSYYHSCIWFKGKRILHRTGLYISFLYSISLYPLLFIPSNISFQSYSLSCSSLLWYLPFLSPCPWYCCVCSLWMTMWQRWWSRFLCWKGWMSLLCSTMPVSLHASSSSSWIHWRQGRSTSLHSSPHPSSQRCWLWRNRHSAKTNSSQTGSLLSTSTGYTVWQKFIIRKYNTIY